MQHFHNFIVRYRFPVILSTAFLDLLGVGVLIPVLPDILKLLHLSGEWAWYSQALYALSTFLVAFWIGGLSDRIGRRPLIFATSFANGLGALLLLLSITGAFSLEVGVFLFLLSWVVSWVSGAWFGIVEAMVSDVAPKTERAKYFGLMGATFGLAFLIWPLVGWFLSLIFGLTCIPIVIIGLVLLNLLAIYFVLPETLHHQLSEHTDAQSSNMSPILQDYGLMLLLFLSAGVTFAFSILTTLSAQYYSDLFAMNSHQIAWVFSWIGLTSIVYQGAIARHLRVRFTNKSILTFALLLLSWSFVWFAMMNQVWMVYVWMVLVPVAFWSFSPIINSLLTIGREYESGRIMGINTSATGLANVLGPVLGALIYAYHIRLPFFFGAIVFLILLWILLFGSRWIFASKSSR